MFYHKTQRYDRIKNIWLNIEMYFILSVNFKIHNYKSQKR